MSERAPTSVILETLIRNVPSTEVTLAWILERLRERSFGIVILLLSLVGLLPGASPIVGVLLAILAIQMTLGRAEPALPRRLAHRRFSATRFVWLVTRVTPALRRIERIVRPRWSTPFDTTKRVVGVVVLLLGGTLLVPVPFSHVIPILTTALLAFAFLEEDGVVLAVAMGAAAVSLALSAATLWGAVEIGRLVTVFGLA